MKKMPKVATKDNRLGKVMRRKSTPHLKRGKVPAVRAPRMAATPPAPQVQRDQIHHAESDMRTLTDAARIKSDSSRHAAAVSHGREQVAHMRKAMRGKMRVDTSDV